MTAAQSDLFRPGADKGAEFDASNRRRYLLWRIWDDRTPPIAFVMLNPSTADHETDDPTIVRCQSYAYRWGDGGLVVANLFAYRAADPAALKAASDPDGQGNYGAIVRAARWAQGRVVCAWGNHGSYRGRAATVVALLRRQRYAPGARRVQLLCLGVNRTGEPVHPLYQPADAPPVPYEPRSSR